MSNIFKEMTTIHDDCVLVGDRDWAHSIPIFASQWEMNLISNRDIFYLTHTANCQNILV